MKSIVILLKHRFLGDAIVATPLIAAVKQVYPDVPLVVVTGAGAAQLLAEHPAIATLRTYGSGTAERTQGGSRRLMRAAWSLASELRARSRPELVFVVDRSLRAALTACRMGARQRVGFDTEGRGFLLTQRVAYDPARPEAECALDLLRAIQPGSYDARPQLYLSATERAAGRVLLPEGAGPWIGIQPGASHDYKQWPLENLATVVTALVRERGARIVLVGGPEERPAAEAFLAQVGVPIALDLTGKTKLRETMGVLANLQLFLGNDTGVNHIAAALGTPTVALFGPTPAHKWGWDGPENRVLVAPDGQMTSLAPEQVQRAAEALLT